MIKEIINKGLTRYEKSFANWEDAVRASAERLKEKGIIDDRYIKATISCVKEYGPYIVLFPGVAMPHSTLGSEGVNDNAISFMKVEQPVYFNEEDAESYANIFFTICAIDNDAHMNNIQTLANALNCEEFVEELKTVTNDQELLYLADKYNV